MDRGIVAGITLKNLEEHHPVTHDAGVCLKNRTAATDVAGNRFE